GAPIAETRLLDSARFPSVGAAIDTVMAALRRDARPAAVRVFEDGEARAHLGGDAAGPGEAVLCAGTVGPADLAAVDRDLLGEADPAFAPYLAAITEGLEPNGVLAASRPS